MHEFAKINQKSLLALSNPCNNNSSRSHRLLVLVLALSFAATPLVSAKQTCKKNAVQNIPSGSITVSSNSGWFIGAWGYATRDNHVNFGDLNYGSNNVGKGNIGDSNQGDWNFGTGNQGSGNNGNYNVGSGNCGSYNVGDGNQGSWNVGIGNRGSYNLGWCNSGTGNTGAGNQGTRNVGVSNSGSGSIGTANSGTGHVGISNTGTGHVGINNAGSANFGVSNSGTGSIGSDNTGDYNLGFYNQGNNNTGVGNYGTGNVGYLNGVLDFSYSPTTQKSASSLLHGEHEDESEHVSVNKQAKDDVVAYEDNVKDDANSIDSAIGNAIDSAIGNVIDSAIGNVIDSAIDNNAIGNASATLDALQKSATELQSSQAVEAAKEIGQVNFNYISVLESDSDTTNAIGWLNANSSNVGVGNVQGGNNIGVLNNGFYNIGFNNTGTSNAGVGNSGDFNVGVGQGVNNGTGILPSAYEPTGVEIIIDFGSAFDPRSTQLTGYNTVQGDLTTSLETMYPSVTCNPLSINNCTTNTPIQMVQSFSVSIRCRGSVKITDLFCAGDSFQVFKDGKLWLTTPIVPPGEASCPVHVDDPEAAFYDPRFSHTLAFLPSGSYKLAIVPLVTVYGGGAVAIKVDDFCPLSGDGSYIRY